MLNSDQFDELEYLFVSYHYGNYLPQKSFNDVETQYSILNRIYEILKEIKDDNI